VMKAGAPAAGPGAGKGRGRALKAERLEKAMKTGVFRELTAIRWKQAFVVRAACRLWQSVKCCCLLFLVVGSGFECSFTAGLTKLNRLCGRFAS
jgi:hypothetical protein